MLRPRRALPVSILVAALSLMLVSEALAEPAASSGAAGPIASPATHAKKCKRIRKKKKRKRCIRRAGPHAPSSNSVFGDEILDDTLQLAIQYANGLYADKSAFPEGTYWWEIPYETCTKINSTTGRCLIYLWKQAYSSGYGYGGFDRAVWREYYIARRYAPGQYSPFINFVDFIDPYYWVCSDAGYYGIPYCGGYINW
jgi:hypothetical protein